MWCSFFIFFGACSVLLSKQKIVYGVFMTVMGMAGTCIVALLWKYCAKKLKNVSCLTVCINLQRRWRRRAHRRGDSVESFSDTEMMQYLDMEASTHTAPPTRNVRLTEHHVLQGAFQQWLKKHEYVHMQEKKTKLTHQEQDELKVIKIEKNDLAKQLKSFKDYMDAETTQGDVSFNFFPTGQSSKEGEVEEGTAAAATAAAAGPSGESGGDSKAHMYKEIWWASLHEYASQAEELYKLERKCNESGENWNVYMEQRQTHNNLGKELCTFTEMYIPQKKDWLLKTFFYIPPSPNQADYRTRLDAYLVEEEALMMAQQRDLTVKMKRVRNEQGQMQEQVLIPIGEGAVPKSVSSPTASHSRQERELTMGASSTTSSPLHRAASLPDLSVENNNESDGAQKETVKKPPLRRKKNVPPPPTTMCLRAREVTKRLSTLPYTPPTAKVLKKKKCEVEEKRQKHHDTQKKDSQVEKNQGEKSKPKK